MYQCGCSPLALSSVTQYTDHLSKGWQKHTNGWKTSKYFQTDIFKSPSAFSLLYILYSWPTFNYMQTWWRILALKGSQKLKMHLCGQFFVFLLLFNFCFPDSCLLLILKIYHIHSLSSSRYVYIQVNGLRKFTFQSYSWETCHLLVRWQTLKPLLSVT